MNEVEETKWRSRIWFVLLAFIHASIPRVWMWARSSVTLPEQLKLWRESPVIALSVASSAISSLFVAYVLLHKVANALHRFESTVTALVLLLYLHARADVDARSRQVLLDFGLQYLEGLRLSKMYSKRHSKQYAQSADYSSLQLANLIEVSDAHATLYPGDVSENVVSFNEHLLDPDTLRTYQFSQISSVIKWKQARAWLRIAITEHRVRVELLMGVLVASMTSSMVGVIAFLLYSQRITVIVPLVFFDMCIAAIVLLMFVSRCMDMNRLLRQNTVTMLMEWREYYQTSLADTHLGDLALADEGQQIRQSRSSRSVGHSPPHQAEHRRRSELFEKDIDELRAEVSKLRETQLPALMVGTFGQLIENNDRMELPVCMLGIPIDLAMRNKIAITILSSLLYGAFLVVRGKVQQISYISQEF